PSPPNSLTWPRKSASSFATATSSPTRPRTSSATVSTTRSPSRWFPRGASPNSPPTGAWATMLPLNRSLFLLPLLPGLLMCQPHADLILIHAKVWTGSAAQPQAEAVALTGNRIAAVGSTGDIQKWAGPQTQVIDLGGRLLLPGFNDAHVHFYT